MDNDKRKSTVSQVLKSISKKYIAIGAGLLALFIIIICAIVFTEIGKTRNASGGMTPEGIREIAEFASLEFRYSDVISIIEEQEFKLFGLVDIDPGESILIVKYQGIIKIGLNSGDIALNIKEPASGEKTQVEMRLPDIKIISSETPLDAFEIVVNKGVYTKSTVDMQAFFDEAAKRQAQHNAEALSAYAQPAKENAKKQIESLFEQFGLAQEYEIIWMD